MMKSYARVVGGLVVETIEPFVMSVPAATDGDGNEVPGFDREVPIEERFHPEFVAMLTLISEGVTVSAGDSFDGTSFGPPPPPPLPPPPTQTEVLAQRDALLRLATLRIAPLQDAVDLDEATAPEIALLKAWKQFRVSLSRVELQAGFPGAVIWPQAPA
ncbi:MULTISPECIES: tail fiber assembly protein [unclassified Variovorax]|uniref:tail fiber assembly protein n=1 Tax=unclassified Variovorax TaxID=663243 RepID=UPI003F45250A